MLYLELATVSILILFNGALALAELAVVSSRPARLRTLVDREVVGARQALALAADPGRFLSTVQIGITLIGVLSGAFSGAAFGSRIAEWLVGLGLSRGSAEALGVGLVVSVITYVSLIVGELVPKQIALRAPERIAVRVAPAMTTLARVASPVVWLLDASGDMVLRALGQHASDQDKVTDEEIHSLIAEAETAGVIEPGERAMIAAVLRLGDRPVRAMMTPRRDVEMLDLNEPQLLRRIAESPHSRFPVYETDPDDVLGVVQTKDLLDAFIRNASADIRAHIRPAPVVPDSADILDVLDVIKNSPVHMTMIHDEYGTFEGIITTADLLESIVGAFRTGPGPVEPDAVRRDDNSWLISGSMPADEMAELLGLRVPADRSYHTAAGFILDHVGHLPELGETIDVQDWRFEIVDLDGHRIDKILAARIPGRRRRVW